MTERNRVTPFGEIVAIPQRGMFMGNRGSIHREHAIVRQWQVRRWITCVLRYKGWVAPKWEPGRWTALFFLDEAVALAAGHRPCALCRRGDYNAWLDAWESAFGEHPSADDMDRTMHNERLEGKRKRLTRCRGGSSRWERTWSWRTSHYSSSTITSSRGRSPATASGEDARRAATRSSSLLRRPWTFCAAAIAP